MDKLSNAMIEDYIATGEPDRTRPGAYGIQGIGAKLIRRIEGCYYNVVGLRLTACAVFCVRRARISEPETGGPWLAFHFIFAIIHGYHCRLRRLGRIPAEMRDFAMGRFFKNRPLLITILIVIVLIVLIAETAGGGDMNGARVF
jgi:hypothetical protein